MAFSAEIHSELDARLVPWQDVSPRKMFGAMAYLVGDRLFAFIYDDWVVVKLPPEDKAAAGQGSGARPFTHSRSRKFGDWMEFPLVRSDEIEDALPWIKRSYQHVLAIPTAPTTKKGRSRRQI